MSYTTYGLVAVLTKHSYEDVKKDLDKVLSLVEKKYSKLLEHIDYYMQCIACNYVIMVLTYSEDVLNVKEIAQEIDNVENKIKERAVAIHYCSDKCNEIADNLCMELVKKCLEKHIR